jgi:hypothetical protein
VKVYPARRKTVGKKSPEQGAAAPPPHGQKRKSGAQGVPLFLGKQGFRKTENRKIENQEIPCGARCRERYFFEAAFWPADAASALDAKASAARSRELAGNTPCCASRVSENHIVVTVFLSGSTSETIMRGLLGIPDAITTSAIREPVARTLIVTPYQLAPWLKAFLGLGACSDRYRLTPQVFYFLPAFLSFIFIFLFYFLLFFFL